MDFLYTTPPIMVMSPNDQVLTIVLKVVQEYFDNFWEKSYLLFFYSNFGGWYHPQMLLTIKGSSHFCTCYSGHNLGVISKLDIRCQLLNRM